MREVNTGSAQLLASVDDDGVGRVVFNNPERHNALNLSMQRALTRALAELGGDPDVRVVVVSGAGDAFGSGADVVEYDQYRATASTRAEYDAVLSAFWHSWDAFEKPTIAMIRGHCIGGGLLVALKADIRVATAGSQFAVAAAALGVGLVTWGVEAMLTAVGPAHASELLFSARRISADEALAVGLVNRVVPDPELEMTTRELATAIVANEAATG